MKITRSNYEAWFLDYLEGRLSKKQIVELHQFLSFQADLQVVLNEYENISLTQENFNFENKASLKHELPVNDTNFDEYAISHYENILTQSEEKDLKEYLTSNSQKQREFELYQKTYLPKEHIIFDYKSSLKRNVIPVQNVFAYSGAAAAIIILLFFILIKPANFNEKPISVNRDKTYYPKVSKVEKTDDTKIVKNIRNKKVKFITSIVPTESTLTINAVEKTEDVSLLDSIRPAVIPVTSCARIKPLAIEVRTTADIVESDSNDYITENTVLGPVYDGLKLLGSKVSSNVKYERRLDSRNHRQYIKLETKFFSYSKTIAGE